MSVYWQILSVCGMLLLAVNVILLGSVAQHLRTIAVALSGGSRRGQGVPRAAHAQQASVSPPGDRLLGRLREFQDERFSVPMRGATKP